MITWIFTTKHTKRYWKLEVDEVKEKIIELLGNEIKFEGHFELVVSNMSEKLQENLLKWVENCREKKERAYTTIKNKKIVAFFFKPSDTRYRGILTKEKDAYYLALFLDKHKYYDRERESLGF